MKEEWDRMKWQIKEELDKMKQQTQEITKNIDEFGKKWSEVLVGETVAEKELEIMQENKEKERRKNNVVIFNVLQRKKERMLKRKRRKQKVLWRIIGKLATFLISFPDVDSEGCVWAVFIIELNFELI